jgi:hypothetical protein
MVLLAFPPPRCLPTFEYKDRSEKETADDGEEIKIDIR